MSLHVRPFHPSDADEWDAFCEAAQQATFLHSRRFLSYHGERFIDQSLIIQEDTRWVGVFPAALHLSDHSCIVSHPGITYGGVLHQGGLRGERMIAALDAVRLHYAAQGRQTLVYKAVPTFYHQSPAQDDLYALFRLGARRIRCDLSSTIDLQHRQPLIKGRKWGFKKAQKSGVCVSEGNQYLSDMWNILAENLSKKYNTVPAHSLEELTLLAVRFPLNIRCVCGVLDGAVVAGVVLFATPTVFHTQYIAASDVGHDVCALDVVIEHCINAGVADQKRWFDFGINNEQAGMILNEGLYRFKNGFGGGGYVHEFYELSLGEHHAT